MTGEKNSGSRLLVSARAASGPGPCSLRRRWERSFFCAPPIIIRLAASHAGCNLRHGIACGPGALCRLQFVASLACEMAAAPPSTCSRAIAAAPGTPEVRITLTPGRSRRIQAARPKTIKAPGHLHVGEDDVHVVVGSEHAHCLVGRGRVAHPAAATAQIFVYHSHEQFVLNSAAAFRVKAACADLSARWTIRLTSVAGSVSNFLIAAPARCKATHVLEAFSYSPSRIFICTGKNVHDKAHLRGPGAALGKLPD